MDHAAPRDAHRKPGERLLQVRLACPDITRACGLARAFADLVRHQRGYLSLEWIRQAEQDAPKPQHPRYSYGRCDRCALAAVFDHLTPSPEARRVLAPLRDALLTGPRPASSLSWLRKNPGLLIAMGTGTIPVNHADALPRSRTTETVRGQLVATGCLSARNTYAADFQRWVTDHLATAESADQRLILHEYGTWRLLPRIHRPRDSRPQTYSTFQYAKARIRAAQSFLTWLAQHDTPLAEATQTDIDDFLSRNPQHLGALEAFLRWTTRTRKSRKLACHKPRSDQPKPALTAEQRWQLLRRALHDDALEPADRLMGALILTYAAPLTKILLLRADDIRVNHSSSASAVYLTLGETEIHLPPVLDQLAIQQRHRPPSRARTSSWTRSRARALLHLAARVEAPLLAQALGITAGTAVRWSELAGRTYGGYAERVVRGRAFKHDS
ncbi:hypothetical protein ACFYZB_34535 [Streptomyces sp. NPDC001852]|uniref:hypothetical protein n=1 Tax=Streptomyces sp. NPDC001852 TaxID=3364619 RepID=UPI0036B0AA65